MSIDAQRYRDAGLSWLRVSDLILLTPGWQRSEGCRVECAKLSRRDANAEMEEASTNV